MAIYEVTTEKGTYQVETEDSQQPPQQAQGSIAEQRMAGRPSAMADLIQNPTTMQHPVGAALRTLGGAAELYQGVPASIALDLQAGRPQDILGNLMKVATGQRPAQYGDVFKGAGVPEPLAATGGLYTDVMLTPGGAEGTVGLVKAVGKGAKALKGLLKVETSLQQAGKAKSALDTLRDTIGKAKSVAIQEVSKVPTDLKMTIKSGRAFNALKNPVYGIEFENSGAIKQTVGNLDKVKTALGELVSSPKFWEEAPKTEIQHIKQLYGQVNQAMKTAAKSVGKDISKPLEAYNKFMEKYSLINKTLVDTAGNLMGNRLRKTFSILSEPAYKQAWKEVSKASPEIKQVMGSMNRRELLKNLLGLSAVGIAVSKGKNIIQSIIPK